MSKIVCLTLLLAFFWYCPLALGANPDRRCIVYIGINLDSGQAGVTSVIGTLVGNSNEQFSKFILTVAHSFFPKEKVVGSRVTCLLPTGTVVETEVNAIHHRKYQPKFFGQELRYFALGQSYGDREIERRDMALLELRREIPITPFGVNEILSPEDIRQEVCTISRLDPTHRYERAKLILQPLYRPDILRTGLLVTQFRRKSEWIVEGDSGGPLLCVDNKQRLGGMTTGGAAPPGRSAIGLILLFMKEDVEWIRSIIFSR